MLLKKKLAYAIKKKTLVLATPFILASCTSLPPPKNQGNICSIFNQYPHWYEFGIESERKWQTPLVIQFAFVKQESSFVSDARPKSSTFGYLSSAYGYAQAIDGTWSDYKKQTRNYGARRDEMRDALDFIGWYNHITNLKLNIPLSNAKHLYLAYHEGWTGYKNGTYRKKKWLTPVASKVARQAKQYNQQLKKCPQ